MRIEVFRLKTDGFFTNTELEISDNEIILSNYDLSKSTANYRGKSDYEYYLIIKKDHFLDFIEGQTDQHIQDYFEAFAKDINLFRNIRKRLDENAVKYEFSTW